jgi:NitT/TauT family transport system permease protein
MRRVLDMVLPLVLLALLVAAWEIACRALAVPTYFLPRPSEVFVSLYQRWPVLIGSAWNTFAMAVAALVLASVCGAGLALGAALSRTFERAVKPLAVALQVTPVVALAPLIVVWAGIDHATLAVVALAAVIAFFPIFSGTLTGLKSADPDLERLFDLYGASPLQRLFKLRLPSSIPFVVQGHKVGLGLAIVGAVVAEFVAGSGQTKGLAWRILEAQHRLRIADMLAALLVLVLLALALNLLVSILEKQALKRWGPPPR